VSKNPRPSVFRAGRSQRIFLPADMGREHRRLVIRPASAPILHSLKGAAGRTQSVAPNSITSTLHNECDLESNNPPPKRYMAFTVKHCFSRNGLYLFSYVLCRCNQPLLPVEIGDHIDKSLRCPSCDHLSHVDITISRTDLAAATSADSATDNEEQVTNAASRPSSRLRAPNRPVPGTDRKSQTTK